MVTIFICISGYWASVFQNAIGCAIGSAIAILVSFFIYWLTNRHNKQTAKREKLADEINQLKAFKLMLQRSIKNTDQLIDHVDVFIPKLKNHPTDFPLLEITSLGNFRRIIESISIEKTGTSYIKHLPSDNAVKEFTSILESIDFMHDAFIGMQEVVQRASLNHFDRVKKVSNRFDIIDKMAIDVISDPRSQSQIIQRIGAIKTNFINERGDLSNVESVNNFYFLPMQSLMREVVSAQMFHPFVVDFSYNLSKGIEFYIQIGTGYDKFVSEMEGMEKTLKENIEKLKGLSEKILKKDLDSLMKK